MNVGEMVARQPLVTLENLLIIENENVPWFKSTKYSLLFGFNKFWTKNDMQLNAKCWPFFDRSVKILYPSFLI